MIPSIQGDRYLNLGYTTEVELTDFTTQTGAPIDTLKQIKFSNSIGDSPNGLINMDSVGNITILKAGPYGFKSRYRVSRLTSSGGTAHIVFFIQASYDQGQTWNVIGNAITVHLLSVDQDSIFFDYAKLDAPAGLMLRSMFARSSTGYDDGFLEPAIPSAALAALGVPNTPSAQITVYKNIGHKY